MIKKSYNFWEKNFLKNRNKKNFIIFITIGCVGCLSMGMELPYINFIYYSIVHPYLITFFLIPTTFYYIFKFSELIKKNQISLYFPTKKKYILFCFFNIFYFVICWLLIFLFIVIILSNLFSVRDFMIASDPNYKEVSNIVGLLFCLCKLFILSMSYSLLFFSSLKLNRYLKITIFPLLIFSLFTMMGYIDFNGVLSLLLPYRYIGFVYIFTSFKEYFFSSLTYCVLLISLSTLLFFYINYKGDVK